MTEYPNQAGLDEKKEKGMSLQFLTRTAVLLAIALAVQWLRLPTYFTGPVVNAVLILATLFSGIWSGIIIGCITPVVALLMGIIPPAAIPLVPLIIAANITLVLVFFFLDKANRYVAWIGSAFAKYGMFYVGLRLLLHLFGVKLPAPLLLAFQIPQLYTALVGGLTAVIIARYLKQRMD